MRHLLITFFIYLIFTLISEVISTTLPASQKQRASINNPENAAIPTIEIPPQISKAQLDDQHKLVVQKIKSSISYSDHRLLLPLMKQLYQQYLDYQWFQEHRHYDEHQRKLRKFLKSTPQQCQELKELFDLFSRYFGGMSDKKLSEHSQKEQLKINQQLKNHFETKCPHKPMFKPNQMKA